MTNQLMRTFLLVVGLVGGIVSATPTKECAYTNYRLPKHIVPKHYNLDISIDTQKYEYKGDVTINLRVDKNEDKQVLNNIIVLNVHPDVWVSDATYVDMGSGMLSDEDFSLGYNNVDEICRDIENELLVINLGENLAHQAEGELIISFHGKVREDSTGIYKSRYKSQAGVDSYLISTNFQPNKARRAFPCFDEPSFKATFDIKITHDSGKVALTNTGLLSEEKRGDRRVSKFKMTPLMSIHQIALAIGEFEYIEKATHKGGPTIRAYTSVGKSHQAKFALDTAVNAFNHLERYNGVPLPLEKIDMLSEVGHSGVRGNWGLIVCNETLFLFDDENSSPIYRGYVAQTVVNGLSQQWFGNLVTLKWWNDLWLQEGFNIWVGYNLTNYLYPDLQWEQNYLIESHQRALELDSQADTHPVRVAEVGKHNIDGLLDELVRLKSTAIVKSLHDVYVEPDKFRDGTRQLIEKRQYGNAEASYLWNTMQEVSKLPVDEFIQSWTEQSGHPLVMASVAFGRSGRLVLEQKRDGRVGEIDTANEQFRPWIIPITILLTDRQRQPVMKKFIIDQQKEVVDLPAWFSIRDNDHWLKVNDDFRGLYHVHYSRDFLLRSLKEPIHLKHLSTSNRIGLLDDFTALYKSNQMKIGIPFTEFMQWYQQETGGVVLGQIVHALSLLLSHSTRMVGLKISLSKSAYDRTKLSSELLQNAGTRNGMGLMDSYGLLAVYSILFKLNDGPVVIDARALFDKKGNKVAPIIRELVYKAVAKYGSVRQIRKLQSFRLVPTSCIEEKNRLDAAFAILSERQQLSCSAPKDFTKKRKGSD